MPSFVFKITEVVKQKTRRALDNLSQKDHWSELPPHPWRRFLARIFDLITISLLLSMPLGILIALMSQSPEDPTQTDHLQLVLSSPAGEWLFGIKVLNAENAKLSFKEVRSREAAIWFEGLALCIPFIALFTLSSAYKKVANNEKTSWDKYGDFKVLYRNLNFKQLILSFLGSSLLISLLIIYYALSFPS